MKKCLALLFVAFSVIAQAQTDSVKVDDADLFDMSLEQLLQLDVVDGNFYVHGYINSNLQKTFGYPTSNGDGSIIKVSDPLEWTPVRNFHLYGKGNLSQKISYLFNLAGNEDAIEIRNAWGNYMVRRHFRFASEKCIANLVYTTKGLIRFQLL